MQLSNTTTQAGLIQKVEKWTRRPYGSSGNELREIINGINNAFEKVLPILLTRNDQIRWDDLNHTDAPRGTVNIVANQNDYKITQDDNSLDILNITHVRAINATGDTQYRDLRRILANDPRVPEILSPDTAITGIPGGFLELGNVLYLDILPKSNVTAGLKIFFQREQNYFTVTGTSGNDTTEPGFPKPFHEILSFYESLEWNVINRPNDVRLHNQLEKRIFNMEKDLESFTDLRNPTKIIMTTKKTSYR